eukprot:4549330-Lingulodinium_polyedra.AAC.1
MRDKQVIALHGRTELDTDPGAPTTEVPPKTTFFLKGHFPQIEAESLSGRATWPALSPRSSQGLAAERVL